jgi:hypothetical protein
MKKPHRSRQSTNRAVASFLKHPRRNANSPCSALALHQLPQLSDIDGDGCGGHFLFKQTKECLNAKIQGQVTNSMAERGFFFITGDEMRILLPGFPQIRTAGKSNYDRGLGI